MTEDAKGSFTYHYPRSAGWSAVGLAVFILLPTLWLLRMVGLPEGDASFAYWLIAAAIGLALLIGGWGLWLMLRNPVVLELDAAGLRGRNLPFICWDEIKEAAVHGAGRYTKLGMKLRDPVAYRRKLKFWQKHTRLNLSFKYDHVVYTGVLTAPAHDINAALKLFLDQRPL